MGKERSNNYDQQVDVGRRLFLEYDRGLLSRKFALEAEKHETAQAAPVR